jgi:hypothetical protein
MVHILNILINLSDFHNLISIETLQLEEILQTCKVYNVFFA